MRTARQTLIPLALGLLTALASPLAHAGAGNELSKRTQLRYEDVLTTRDGSRWRGKIIQKGDIYRIRLEDKSEVAVLKENVMSVSRELQPGYPHTSQWVVSVEAGVEIAIVAADANGGAQFGPLVQTTFSRNLGGPLEAEVIVAECPLGPDDGGLNMQLGLGVRYYLAPNKRAKPYTSTEVVLYGSHGDLGLRTGPGMMYDVTPNFGIGFAQGVTLMSQTKPKATGVGYHVMVATQGRF